MGAVAADPLERNNLALEVSEDIGQVLLGGVDGGWVATGAVNDV
jgi:hypothetical protein